MGLSWRSLLITAIALSFVGSVIFIATILVRAFGTNDSTHQYAIIMDAGSSHTDVILYKWYTSKERQGIIEKVDTCTTQGGIDDHEENVTQTVSILIPCLVNVTKEIEFEEARVVPIYLGATAGMRMLDQAQSTVAQLVFLKIENTLLKYKEAGKLFDVRQVGLLSNEEEAVSSWITANFVSDVLTDNNNNNKATVGVLEQGGASAQIAYEVVGNLTGVGVGGEESDGFKLTPVHLYGKSYAVRGTSHLCLGADEILARYRTLLILNSGQVSSSKDEIQIDDPCGHTGHQVNISGTKLNTICTVRPDNETNVDLSVNKYAFKGAYDEDKCKEWTNTLVNYQACGQSFKICFKPELRRPSENLTFYAIGNYFHATESLRNGSKSVFDKKDFEEGRTGLCSKSSEELSQVFKSPKSLKFAPNFCFHLHFFSSAFDKLYKFSSNSWQKIHFVNQIENRPLGWPLGFAINATANYVGERPLQVGTPAIGNFALVSLLVVSIALIFAGLVLFGLWKSKDYKKYSKTNKRDEYNLS